MQGLVSDLATDPELAQAFRERVVSVRDAEVERLVERGIARGDLRPDTDPETAHELLIGPVYYRLLLTGGRSIARSRSATWTRCCAPSRLRDLRTDAAAPGTRAGRD